MRKMKFENTINELFVRFPMLKEAYEEEGDHIEGLSHLCYAFVFVPFIRQTVLANDEAMIRSICEFMENMALSDDEDELVSELLVVSVLENILYERDVINLLKPHLGAETLKLLISIEKAYGLQDDQLQEKDNSNEKRARDKKMSNKFKVKREEMLQEAIKNEPRIAVGKKLTFIICAVFLSARLLFAILETVFMINRGLPVNLYIFNYASLIISFVFSIGIYKMGTKALAYLGVVGAVFSMFFVIDNSFSSKFQSGEFSSNFQSGDTLYKFYIITLIVTIIIQIISMLLIIFNADCKKYFNEIKRIQKSILGIVDCNN